MVGRHGGVVSSAFVVPFIGDHMSDQATLDDIEDTTRELWADATAGEAGTPTVADVINRLRGIIDDGLSGREGTERWQRVGAVMEVLTSQPVARSNEAAVGAFVRQLCRDLVTWFRQAEPGTTRRSQLLWWLWLAISFDIDTGSGRLYEHVSDVLDDQLTVSERHVLQDWLEAYLEELGASDEGRRVDVRARRRDAGFLLLRLLWDELDPEARLELAESTDQVFPQISALLEMGRGEDALELADELEVEFMPDAVLLFGEHGELRALDGILPDADEDGLWPELACNLAGAYLDLGEPALARPWALRAIRDKPNLEFVDFWREHASDRADWRAVEEGIFEVLAEVAPLTMLHFWIREESYDKASQLWQALDWQRGEDERFQESTVRQLANMAKQEEQYRLAVDLGLVTARYRIAQGTPTDIRQAREDFEESLQLLEGIGAEEQFESIHGELADLRAAYPDALDGED